MPTYNTATVAAALEVTPKWLDNLLSHNNIAGIQPESQGVSRRLSLAAITTIALAKELTQSLRLPVPAAIELATLLADSPTGEVAFSALLRVGIHRDRLSADVLTRLAHAVEIVPTPRRGRPPGKPGADAPEHL